MTRPTVVVTGASGAVGGAAVRFLAEWGERTVVAMMRRAHEAAALPDGVAYRLADYRAPEALHAAFDGADVILFISSDGETARVMVHHRNVVDAAVRAGVDHVVYLSGLDADVDSPFCYAVTNAATERMLIDADVGYSIVRSSVFAEFFARWPRAAVDNGVLSLPAGSGRVSLVARADVARALAAAACREPSGRHYDVTGPETLTMLAIAERYQRAMGAPMRYIDVPARQHCIAMAHEGVDPWWAYAYDTMFASIREQRWAAVSDDYEQLTGQSPAPFTPIL